VEVSVVTSGHDVADARLHRLVAALARAGLRVEVLGLGTADAGPPEAINRTQPRGSLARRALGALRLPWRCHGRVLISLDPDVAVGCAMRRLLAGPKRLVWVAEVHEDYLALLEDRAWAKGPRGVVGRAVARAGLTFARRADLTVVVDDYLARTARRRMVVPNVPDMTMLPAPVPLDAQPRAIYIGDLTASRGLFTMLKALELAPDWTLDLVGRLSAEDATACHDELALNHGLASRVKLHGLLPPRQAWAVAAGAWAGLSLLEDTRAFRATMPSKVYEYLACGLPVLTSPLARPAELIKSSGAGAVVGDAAATAQVLNQWLIEPAAYQAAAEAAQAASAEMAQQCGQMDQLAHQIQAWIRR